MPNMTLLSLATNIEEAVLFGLRVVASAEITSVTTSWIAGQCDGLIVSNAEMGIVHPNS